MPAIFSPLRLPDVLLVEPQKFSDDRGFFVETYNERDFLNAGIKTGFVQDNHSLSKPNPVLRGLHFQKPPHAQAKLVRVLKGAIFDVAVDIRKGSPTFGEWVGECLTAENGRQLYVPEGFAHGFVTLEPDTEVAYKVSSLYAPESDAGIVWNDPDLAIDWQTELDNVILSQKDKQLPRLSECDTGFVI